MLHVWHGYQILREFKCQNIFVFWNLETVRFAFNLSLFLIQRQVLFNLKSGVFCKYCEREYLVAPFKNLNFETTSHSQRNSQLKTQKLLQYFRLRLRFKLSEHNTRNRKKLGQMWRQVLERLSVISVIANLRLAVRPRELGRWRFQDGVCLAFPKSGLLRACDQSWPPVHDIVHALGCHRRRKNSSSGKPGQQRGPVICFDLFAWTSSLLSINFIIMPRTILAPWQQFDSSDRQ